MSMKEYPSRENVRFKYSVYAVIFGADETLLKIKLHDGFSFKRLSLIPHVDNLDKIFDTNNMGLRRDYETARLDHETLDVICAVKSETYTRSVTGSYDQYHQKSDDDLIRLDNQIRIIRLIVEAPLRFKRMACNLSSERYLMVNDMSTVINCNEIIPIAEAIKTNPISSFHCSEKEAEMITSALSEIHLPLQDELLNICHGYYDLSYHTEKYISITLLITALEILFLEKNTKGKKEILAKRCSVYLFCDEAKSVIKDNYKKIKAVYKKRSEFVHDGKVSKITDDDILYLRECGRNSLLKALSLTENKKQRIERIKNYVEQNNDIFGE